jgi:hypothetical protein
MAYVNNPPVHDRKWRKKFRRRFRMPYEEYLKLVEKCKEDTRFARWLRQDATGRPSSPIELLVLASLRYLGRGLTFDDLEEQTAISEEVIRVFFHQFIDFGRTVLFEEFVLSPQNAEEAQHHLREFSEAGFPGCPGSCDASQVIMWNCFNNLINLNKGFKEKSPTRTYNVTCNHRRRILYSTTGHPGRWNDKSVIKFDDFVRGIHDGKKLQDVEFHLFQRVDGVVTKVLYRGAWVIVDNGYMRWTCTQAPIKGCAGTWQQLRWAKWIEAMRKDVECLFGILKGRFRILKTGSRLFGPEATDKIWLTCCALHNWLLEVDGLDKAWQNGVPSEWEGELGQNDPSEIRLYTPALRQHDDNFLRNLGSREHELESRNRRLFEDSDSDGDSTIDEAATVTAAAIAAGDAISVNSLSYFEFQARLIESFHIRYFRKRLGEQELSGDVKLEDIPPIKWPSRNSNGQVPAHIRALESR